MNQEIIINIEKMSGRELSHKEQARIRDVSSSLNIRDDDAVWALFGAMEYQRVYYEGLPDKIEQATRKITDNIASSAEKEAKAVQAKLTESIISEAHYLASRIQFGKIIPLAIVAVIILMAYSALCMWAGFQLGALETRNPYEILLMPWSTLSAIICSLFGAAYLSIAVGNSLFDQEWKIKHIVISIAIIVASFSLISIFTGQEWPRDVFYHLKK